MWDIHKIIHDFSTTIDGLYMGDTQDGLRSKGWWVVCLDTKGWGIE